MFGFILRFEKIRPFKAFCIFLFAFFIRAYLEFISSNAAIDPITHFHYLLAYINVGLSLALIFSIILGQGIRSMFSLIFSAYPVIILAPILDLIIFRKPDIFMGYLNPYTNIFYNYITFFGNGLRCGITIGIRLEILVILVFIFYYALRIKDMMRALIITWLAYTTLFLYSAISYPLFFMSDYMEIDDTNLIIAMYLIILFIQIHTLFWLYSKKYYKIVILNLQFSRILHYFSLFLLGYSLRHTFGYRYVFDFINIAMGCVFLGVFITIRNNIFDVKSDSINKPENPLVNDQIDMKIYRYIANISLVISIFYFASLGYQGIFVALLSISLYGIYSEPPFRLKRILLLSKAPLSLLSVAWLWFGHSLREQRIHLDFRLLVILFLAYLIGLNIIDFKDKRGDKLDNIITIPIVIGYEKLIAFIILYIFYLLFIHAIFKYPFFEVFISPLVVLPMFLHTIFLIKNKEFRESAHAIVYILFLIINIILIQKS